MINFIVEGVPVGKARPRVTKFGTYTPQKTKDYEKLVQWSFKNAYKGQALECPIKLEIAFYMYIPKRTSEKRTQAKINGDIVPTKKPDWDNMAKSITDALNGLAYKDDNQIVEAHIYKFFSDRPRAVVTISGIDKKGV